jgi:class 3 adenylate cyclase
LRPGIELKVPANAVSTANKALIDANGQIQTANQAGAQIFAVENIGKAIALHDEALTRRVKSDWGGTHNLATLSFGEATVALEKSQAARDRAAEALVTDRHGQVEGQRPQDLGWRGLQIQTTLIEEEKVRTLSDSTAQMRFNEMIVHLNERFQLAKFVSGGTMAAIQGSDAEGVKLGGARRTVAILFADIRGYTSFAEGRSPEEVVEVLNHYFQRLADIVAQNHGDIDKYVGDQIMATFQGDEMAANAVACCLQFSDEMIELRRQNPEWALDIGSGVDAGEVVMGAMGSKNRMDYTVLGDHVNIAARLCSHAAPRQTLVTGRVYEQLKNAAQFAFTALEPIRVKGKSAALEVYDVKRAEPAIAAAASDDSGEEKA